MQNTCSIKPIKNTYIGVGVRMSSGEGTVPFDNIPMKGMVIEDYNQQGFKLSHPNLPRPAWVDFDQLPLNRLVIKNGVIEDELAFVENIVTHRMQLIKTLDTEYIDMLYAQKELKERKIIPISNAVPGNYYIGAQCENGTEMIYLGTWYGALIREEKSWDSKGITKYYLENKSPKRAFFLIVDDNDIPYGVKERMTETYSHLKRYAENNARYWHMEEDERERWDATKKEQKKMLESEIKQYKSKYHASFKLVNYSITSKIVKNLIDIDAKYNFRGHRFFRNKNYNRYLCQYFPNHEILDEDTFHPGYEGLTNILKYRITNSWFEDFPVYLQDRKEGLLKNGLIFVNKNYGIKLQPKFYNERHCSEYTDLYVSQNL